MFTVSHFICQIIYVSLVVWWHVNSLTIWQIRAVSIKHNAHTTLFDASRGTNKLTTQPSSHARAPAQTPKPNIIIKGDKCWLVRWLNRWHVLVTRHHVTGSHSKQLSRTCHWTDRLTNCTPTQLKTTRNAHTNKQQHHIPKHPQTKISCVEFAINNRVFHSYNGDMLDGTMWCVLCVARPVTREPAMTTFSESTQSNKGLASRFPVWFVWLAVCINLFDVYTKKTCHRLNNFT